MVEERKILYYQCSCGKSVKVKKNVNNFKEPRCISCQKIICISCSEFNKACHNCLGKLPRKEKKKIKLLNSSSLYLAANIAFIIECILVALILSIFLGHLDKSWIVIIIIAIMLISCCSVFPLQLKIERFLFMKFLRKNFPRDF